MKGWRALTVEEFRDKPATVASLATTILLGLLTAFYALSTYRVIKETRQMADERRKSR